MTPKSTTPTSLTWSGEQWFVAYLLVKGVRVPERPALVPAAA